jgi:hypothetical protein
VAEFQINGRQYRTTKLDPRTALHVMRRLGAVLTSFNDIFVKIGDAAALVETYPDMSPEERAARVAAAGVSAAEPLAKAVGEMSDAQVDYVLDSCMSVCSRFEETQWVPVWDAALKRSRFENDIDLMVMLQIVQHVLTDNLQGLFPALPSSSSAREPQTSNMSL